MLGLSSFSGLCSVLGLSLELGLSLRAELGLTTPKVGGHRVRPQALGVIIWKKACAMGRGPINME